MRLSRVPHIVDSALVDVPTVVGWLRPLILLPVAALANLTPAQVDSILAHELAHVRRHDYLVNVLQTLTETLLFYHPAVWWVSARVRAEREHCCDEIAVEICGDAADYARALVELESWRVSSATMALAATGGSLFDRVRRIMRAPATDAAAARRLDRHDRARRALHRRRRRDRLVARDQGEQRRRVSHRSQTHERAVRRATFVRRAHLWLVPHDASASALVPSRYFGRTRDARRRASRSEAA